MYQLGRNKTCKYDIPVLNINSFHIYLPMEFFFIVMEKVEYFPVMYS